MNFGYYLEQSAKINSKWIINPSVKLKLVKLLELNIGENDLRLGKCFLDKTPKT